MLPHDCNLLLRKMTNLLDGITLSELRGRKQRALAAEPVRPLTEADLAFLTSKERATAPKPLMRIRDRHHAIARMVANGMSNGQISLISGMDPSRISVLRTDPTFKELVSDYQSIDAGLQAEFMERATTLTLTAMESIQDDLEDPERDLPTSTKLEIAKFGSDRIGHGPVTKTSNVNVNVELATRISTARKRALLDVTDAEFTTLPSRASARPLEPELPRAQPSRPVNETDPPPAARRAPGSPVSPSGETE